MSSLYMRTPPRRLRTFYGQGCDCECACQMREGYETLPPAKGIIVGKRPADLSTAKIMVPCKHFSSCPFKGQTCNKK